MCRKVFAVEEGGGEVLSNGEDRWRRSENDGKKLNTSLQLDRVNETLRNQFTMSEVSQNLKGKV